MWSPMQWWYTLTTMLSETRWLQGMQPMGLLNGSWLLRLVWSVRSSSPPGTPRCLQTQTGRWAVKAERWTGLGTWCLRLRCGCVSMLGCVTGLCWKVGRRTGQHRSPNLQKGVSAILLSVNITFALQDVSSFSCMLQLAVPRVIIKRSWNDGDLWVAGRIGCVSTGWLNGVATSSCHNPCLACWHLTTWITGESFTMFEQWWIQNVFLFWALSSCPALCHPNWHWAALKTQLVVVLDI